MANYTTGAQRYNNRMEKIFSNAKILNAKHDAGRATHSKESHKGEYSSCSTCNGNSSSKSRALKK